jgi:hypothetical protein
MGDFYTIYLVNIKEKRYETFYCDTLAEREIIEDAARVMESLFGLDHFCVKYVEPEFEDEE